MKGTGGLRIIQNIKISLYFHGLGGVVKGMGNPKSIENITISLYSDGLGGVVMGGGMVKGTRGPRIIEISEIPPNFRGLGAGGPRTTANAKSSLFFHGLVGVVQGAGGPRFVKKAKISRFCSWFGRRGERRANGSRIAEK